MQRYAEALNALNTALNLMIDEGDTLLVASISHPLHMAESQLVLRRAEKLTAAMTGRQIAQNSGTGTDTPQ